MSGRKRGTGGLRRQTLKGRSSNTGVVVADADGVLEKGTADYVPLAQLAVGVDCEIRVLICRQWDATYLQGKYIGAAFIVSDSEGGSILCTARTGIAQRFVARLLPGKIYSLKNFTVSLNKDMFRVRNSDSHIIILEGNTIMKSLECPFDGFVRYPFQLVDFEDVVCNGSKFLVNVIGTLSGTTSPKVTPSGTQFMDCHIMNQSHMFPLLKRKTEQAALFTYLGGFLKYS